MYTFMSARCQSTCCLLLSGTQHSSKTAVETCHDGGLMVVAVLFIYIFLVMYKIFLVATGLQTITMKLPKVSKYLLV